jgi:hypothetical protein
MVKRGFHVEQCESVTYVLTSFHTVWHIKLRCVLGSNFMGEKTVSVSVYPTESLYSKMQKVADGQHRSVSNLFIVALTEFLGKPENVAFWSENFGDRPGQVKRPTAPHLRGPVIQAHADTNGRQVDITEAIAAAVKRGPVKPAKHK